MGPAKRTGCRCVRARFSAFKNDAELDLTACACCSAVARGCMAFAMAALGIVAPTMDVHAIAQSSSKGVVS